MIALVILAAIGVWSLVVLGFCRNLAPKTDEERRYDDEQQMAALAKTARGRGGVIGHSATPATGYIEPDPAPPHGIERPSQDVPRRAGLS